MKTQYKNNTSNEIVTVIDPIAAGMCYKTIGLTLVIYKNTKYKYHQIMEHNQFHNQFTIIKKEIENIG